jgi:histidine triad (HIT) family protein
MTTDCIFCSIVAGDTPADVLAETENIMFFRDINPKARVHALGITKEHVSSVVALNEKHDDVIGELIRQAGVVAAQLGITESGFRLISNAGPDAGQDVDHIHVHLLGGEPLGPIKV